MKQVAILGTNGWPFLMRYWMELFPKWEDAVDRVYIALTEVPDELREYVRQILKHPKITVLAGYHGWPQCLTDIFNQTSAPKNLFLHDDTLIFNGAKVQEHFDLLEPLKIITPPHPIYSGQDIVEGSLYKLYPWTKEVGCSFLMYYLFLHRKDLQQIDINFNVWKQEAHKYCPLLQVTPDKDFGGDTGFYVGLQLLQLGAVITPIPRYSLAGISFDDKALETLAQMKENKTDVFSDEANYLHIQNMGNTIPFWFSQKERHGIDTIPAELRKDERMRRDIAMKLAWIEEFMGVDSYKQISDYCQHIKEEMKYIKELFTIEQATVDQFRLYYHAILFGEAK